MHSDAALDDSRFSVRSMKAFAEAILNHATEPDVRLGLKFDFNCNQLVGVISTVDAMPDWCTVIRSVPTTRQECDALWRELKHRNITKFLTRSVDGTTLVIIVREGLWQSIDPLFFSHAKTSFREIELDECIGLFNTRSDWHQAWMEYSVFGMSVSVI